MQSRPRFQVILRVLLPVLVVGWLLSPDTARADASPGDACTTANAFIRSGGPELSGKTYAMTCQGGIWVNVMATDTSGDVGVKQATPAATLDVNGEIKVGSTSVACSSGIQGAIRYNTSTNALEFCDGLNWNGFPATSCSGSTPTAFSFTNVTGQTISTLTTSNIVQVNGISCVVSTAVTGSGSPQYEVCSDNACASVVIGWTSSNASISSGQYVRMRLTSSVGGSTTITATLAVGAGSSTWSVGTQAYCTGGTTPVGTICTDGSMYVGLDTGSVPMYVTPCDAGQTYSSGSCSGTRLVKTWNNGAGSGTSTGATSASDGKGNTTTLAALADTDSPYNAALTCHNLNLDGHTDWFLPSKNQFTNMNTAGAITSADNFNVAVYARYWSSTETATTTAYEWYTASGLVSDSKTSNYDVRCMRE